MLTLCHYLSGFGLMLLAGVFSNKISRRLNVPILIMFLLFGIILGANVEMDTRDFASVNTLGAICMSFILFSGGLDTSFRQVKPVLLPGSILATAGVVITAAILGVATYFILDPDILIKVSPDLAGEEINRHRLMVSLLLGAIISSTDAAAVFAILSGRSVSLKNRLKPLLELESGSNDPMAYFLTLFCLELIMGKSTLTFSTPLILIYRMGMGVLCGWVLGQLGRRLFRTELEYEGLYFVLGVALVLLAYGLTETLQANGMMACYVCGITLGHFRFDYQKSITRFSDGISWLMQVALFICLGIFASISLLPKLFWSGLILAAILMFIARPAAVWLCLIGQKISPAEKWLISWVGLRGAAPIVFATFPLAYLSGEVTSVDVRAIFNLIFIMVLVSLIVQGSTLMPFAKYLKLDHPLQERDRSPLELERNASSRGREMFEFTVKENSPAANRTLAELGLPHTLLVTMIRRDNNIIQPRGATEIKVGDGVTIMGEIRELQKLAEEYFPDERHELKNEANYSFPLNLRNNRKKNVKNAERKNEQN